MMGDGDICDGLGNRYGGGIPGSGGLLGFDLCDLVIWALTGAVAVGTVAITSFALASGGDGSPYRFHANQYQIYDFGIPNYEIPNYEMPGYEMPFPDGFPLPGSPQPE
jgi:hypothetical protein